MLRPESTRRRWAVWAAVFALFTADGLAHTQYRVLERAAMRQAVPPIEPFINEMTGSWAGFVLFVPLVSLVRRLPLGQGNWLRRLPLYVAAAVAWSVAHTTLLVVSRALVWRALGLGNYHYGVMSIRYLMEGANDVGSFWIQVGIVVGVDAWRAARERAVREADLRAELARAQVQSLERRLHPHFLFNALNTISAVMYEDLATADRMIAGLSDLLRRALRAGDAEEVALAEELALLESYLDIMRARFEDRLVVAVDADDEAKAALVPPLLLQPVVENAIRHGADPASQRVEAALSARREGGALRLTVRDHGRGLPEGISAKAGVGLSTTARVLRALYGDAQRLSLENAEGGGLRVIIELPFRPATGRLARGGLRYGAPAEGER
jgi:two-component sensor histidine kinase